MQEAQRIKATSMKATTVKRRGNGARQRGALSESGLLGMPEADYMNEQQLNFFRGRLEAMREDVARRRGDDADWSSEFEPDPSDRASQEEKRFIAERLDDRAMAELREIDAALERIRDGRYGYCLRTGEAIGLRRLLALPTAALSVDAESREEARKRQFS